MKGLIYSEPADRWRLVRDRKGTPGINTFPYQDGCELGKRLKKGFMYKVMRLKALVPVMRLKALAPAMI